MVKIHFSKAEFEKLIVIKKYRNNDKTKASTTRSYRVLEPGLWQELVTDKLWHEHRISCGFLYKRGRIHEDSAAIKGINYAYYFILMYLL